MFAEAQEVWKEIEELAKEELLVKWVHSFN